MVIRFKTENSHFEINTQTKTVRRIPDNQPGSRKQYVRISKPQIGAQVLIVWEVDDRGNSIRSTLTNNVVSYQTVN